MEAWRGREERGAKTRALGWWWGKRRKGKEQIGSSWQNGSEEETGVWYKDGRGWGGRTKMITGH